MASTRKQAPFLTPAFVLFAGVILFLWGAIMQSPLTLVYDGLPLYIVQIRAGLMLSVLGLVFQTIVLAARIRAAKKKESKDS